jgi:hypothetical protein
MRDVQMVYGRRLWLADRESTFAKRARWNCEGAVTCAAMCPASFLLLCEKLSCGGMGVYLLSEVNIWWVSECTRSTSKLHSQSRVTAPN